MTSQVIFKLDSKLKDRAMKKAQKEGVALSAVLKFATKAYIEGDLEIGLVRPEERFNAKTARQIREAIRDFKAGRNLSPAFHSAKEAIEWLDAEDRVSKKVQKTVQKTAPGNTG